VVQCNNNPADEIFARFACDKPRRLTRRVSQIVWSTIAHISPARKRLIIPLLISTSLSVLPVKDTVWWDTSGGKVLEHRDQTDVTCSLMLYDDNGSVTFQWDDPGRTTVTAININWQFPDDWKLPLAMRVGDVWLSDRGGSVVTEAVGHGSTVAFTTAQPLDDLLRPAHDIEIRTKDAYLSIAVRHDKIETLLSRARLCRDGIEK